MRVALFVPRPSGSLERIKRYSFGRTDQSLREAVFRLERVLWGDETRSYLQAPTMGRSCFEKVGARYLSAKGIGPGPASEITRLVLDRNQREDGSGAGGCLRLDTGGFHPLLVPFRRAENRWEVRDPRPEGFSGLVWLVREAEAAEVYRAVGVRTLAPLLLLRRQLSVPWGSETRAALETYLSAQLPSAIREYVDHAAGRECTPIAYMGMHYCSMNGGVLVRLARSPFRVADLQSAATARDGGFLRYLTAHALWLFKLCNLSPESLRALGLRFAHRLGLSAARLFADGILHGQLALHHQNVTLAAEIADLDASIFLRSLPQYCPHAPFDERRLAPAYATFWNNVRIAEQQQSIQIVCGIHADVRQRLGLYSDGREEQWLAAAMLGQVYELYLHALRLADLTGRTVSGNLDRAGVALPLEQVASLRQCFVNVFAEEVARKCSEKLLAWAFAKGWELLLSRVRRSLGTRSLYGWTSSSVPIEHLSVRLNRDQTDHVHQEITAFFSELSRWGSSISATIL